MFPFSYGHRGLQRIRGFTSMRYINRLFTYFTYLHVKLPSTFFVGTLHVPNIKQTLLLTVFYDLLIVRST